MVMMMRHGGRVGRMRFFILGTMRFFFLVAPSASQVPLTHAVRSLCTEQALLLPEPSGGTQQDRAAMHWKMVPQSQSSPAWTMPSPQKAVLTLIRQAMRVGEPRFFLTRDLVHGDRISWFSLWPSFEYLDIKNRPFTHCSKK